ncbi:hypothetical protein KAM622c_38420 [Klebsiella quasipneumoniae subsp. quasipneumoniae]|nr:hypothetical protein KAM622c_38420 [Klebsiella quasipneumoniae subsp. quasipneumoniae]
MSRLIPENPCTSAGWHSHQFRGREVAYGKSDKKRPDVIWMVLLMMKLSLI